MKHRADFPMIKQLIHGHPLLYLDSAATTLKPQVVIDTLKKYYEEECGTVHRAIYYLAANATRAYDQVRQKVQHFLNAKSSNEIIFTKGTTESINLVADCFGRAFIKENDEILIGQLEHHSNIVPWQMMADKQKAKLIVIPADVNGNYCLESLKKLLTNRTQIVSFAHISNSIGTIHPIKEMIELAHLKGAKVFIDAAQSAPHIPIDVQDLDVDFLAFSGHKIYGPTGVGILYGKAELLDQLPPYQGGGDMIEQVSFEKTTYAPIPSRFEAGTPMIASVLALGAAIDYINSIGFSKIVDHEHNLFLLLKDQLKSINEVQLIGRPRFQSGIVSFIVPTVHSLDIATLLDTKGIAIRSGHHCSQPTMNHFGITHSLRASVGIYNTEEEIIHFANELKNIIHILK